MVGVVYFMVHDNALWRAGYPMVKIGVTESDLSKRLESVSTSSPIPLMVAGVIKHRDPYKFEAYLHRMFQRERLNGEWFRLTPGMIAQLRTYNVDGDRFDDLFEFGGTGVKDAEIAALRREVNRLCGEISTRDRTISDLKIKNSELRGELIRKMRSDRKFKQSCKY